MKTNALYYGDNLEILRGMPDESVHLVYLDPPFSSQRAYNLIFRDESGQQSDAQLTAFDDTWHWGPSAEVHYAYLTNTARHQGRVPQNVSALVAALRAGLGANQMTAYLVEMTVRLVELHRVLRADGSMYLHCDPTASHYLKVILDAIFGPTRFRNEIVWKRSDSHNDATQGARRYGRVHDTLLFYTKGDEYTFNTMWIPLSKETADGWYRHVEPETGRRYNHDNVTAAKPGGDTSYEFQGVRPPKGRYWAYSRANMEKLHAEGRLVFTATGKIYRKRYLDESKGSPLQDLWTDIDMLRGFSSSKERLGYPTQKPLALLERIISVSSNPGDVVLDPFCGCGTAVVASQKLGRTWIGIDITYLAIAVMRARLRDAFSDLADVEIVGRPTEVEGARQLATDLKGRYQFQWWALDMIGAAPATGDKRQGGDKGIDGLITFTGLNGQLHTVIVSVKSGNVNPGMVRDLKGTVEREKAAMGVMVSLEEPSQGMRDEAAAAGLYRAELVDRDYPKIQIVSVADLLERSVRPKLPPLVLSPYTKAGKVETDDGTEQQAMFG